MSGQNPYYWGRHKSEFDTGARYKYTMTAPSLKMHYDDKWLVWSGPHDNKQSKSPIYSVLDTTSSHSFFLMLCFLTFTRWYDGKMCLKRNNLCLQISSDTHLLGNTGSISSLVSVINCKGVYIFEIILDILIPLRIIIRN